MEQWRSPGLTITTPTSGTTKGAKEITLFKSDMLLSARATLSFLGLVGEDKTFVSSINPMYIGGKMMMVRAIVGGGRFVQVTPSLDPTAGLPSGLEKIDLWAIVPAQVEALLVSESLPEVSNIIIGGAPLSPSLENRLIKQMPDTDIYSTYGMTETSSHVALRRLGSDVYHAMDGVKFGIDDDSCLVIMRDGATWSPLVTRDVVELVSPVEMRWLGRADNVINSGGIKVHPEELENEIAAAIPHIPPFYITSRYHQQWGEAITMVVEVSSGSFDSEALLSALKAKLPQRRVPKAIEIVEKFDRTATGKIRR